MQKNQILICNQSLFWIVLLIVDICLKFSDKNLSILLVLLTLEGGTLLKTRNYLWYSQKYLKIFHAKAGLGESDENNYLLIVFVC